MGGALLQVVDFLAELLELRRSCDARVTEPCFDGLRRLVDP